MIFEDVVRKAVKETSGAVAGMIMARDGIALYQHFAPESGLDPETLGIEYANLLKLIMQHTEAMNSGAVKEVTLNTEKFTSVIRVLTPEYFMALILTKNGNPGKGRFLLRVNAPHVLKEL